jgi:hypothetical protein
VLGVSRVKILWRIIDHNSSMIRSNALESSVLLLMVVLDILMLIWWLR